MSASPTAVGPSECPGEVRITLVVLIVIAVAGCALGFSGGQLPRRDAQPLASEAAPPATSGQRTAPDLQLYREIVAEVRGGGNYYGIAANKLPQFGFPTTSPLNWRLPTYAWVFAQLPTTESARLVLAVLSIAGLALAFVANARSSSLGYAALTTFLLFGVVCWTFDGDAYLAQEPWAAALILISLSAYALAGRGRSQETGNSDSRRSAVWSGISIAAGTLALIFRELALPYCGIACLLAAWKRRWIEAAAWAAGLELFFAFFAWHVGQVQAQLAATNAPSATDLTQWLRLGGLDYVLLTTRMNSLLFTFPGWLLWLYLVASLIGLAHRREETSTLACFAALSYILTFAFLGRPENFYWGLLPAPLLAWGTAHAPSAICEHTNPTR
jgi:hypothetical protein